jgi:hypothetical protein
MIRASIGCSWAVCRCFEQYLNHPDIDVLLPASLDSTRTVGAINIAAWENSAGRLRRTV